MGFSKYLKNAIVHEWKDFYVDYERLKLAISHRKRKQRRKRLERRRMKKEGGMSSYESLIYEKSNVVGEKFNTRNINDEYGNNSICNEEKCPAGSHISNNPMDSTKSLSTSSGMADPLLDTFKYELQKVEHFYRLLEEKTEEERHGIIEEVKNGQWGKRVQKVVNKIVKAEEKKTKERTSSLSREISPDNTTAGMANGSVNGASGSISLSNLSSMTYFNFLPSLFSRRRIEKRIIEFLHSLVKVRAYKELNKTAFKRILGKIKKETETNRMDSRSVVGYGMSSSVPETVSVSSNTLNTNSLSKGKTLSQNDPTTTATSQTMHSILFDSFISTNFNSSTKVDDIKSDIQRIYKKIFTKKQAETVFSRIKKGVKSTDFLYILFGSLSGVNFSTIVALLWICCNHDGIVVLDEASRSNILFNNITSTLVDNVVAVSLLALGAALFGFCLKAFKHFRINYKFIFNFNYSSSLNNARYLSTLGIFHFIFLAIQLYGISLEDNGVVFGSGSSKTSTVSYPSLCLLGLLPLITFFINPYDCLFYDSRFYFLGSFCKCIFVEALQFRHFYFIDVAQSFSYSIKILLRNIGVSGNRVASGFLSVFSVIRIIQCLIRYFNTRHSITSSSSVPMANDGLAMPYYFQFHSLLKSFNLFPHIINAVKYSIGLVFLFVKVYYLENMNKVGVEDHYSDNIFLVLVFLGSVNCLFGLLWDFLVDWCLIRDTFMFPTFVYYGIVVINIAVRTILFLNVIYIRADAVDNSAISAIVNSDVILAVLEIVRRFCWTLLRVELEHLNNCDRLKINKVLKLTNAELFYHKDEQKQEYNEEVDSNNNEETDSNNNDERDCSNISMDDYSLSDCVYNDESYNSCRKDVKFGGGSRKYRPAGYNEEVIGNDEHFTLGGDTTDYDLSEATEYNDEYNTALTTTTYESDQEQGERMNGNMDYYDDRFEDFDNETGVEDNDG